MIRLKNKKKILFAISVIFFSVLYLVIRNLPYDMFVTAAAEWIYWGLPWICLIALSILGPLWKRECRKGNNDPNAKNEAQDDTDTEDGSVS